MNPFLVFSALTVGYKLLFRRKPDRCMNPDPDRCQDLCGWCECNGHTIKDCKERLAIAKKCTTDIALLPRYTNLSKENEEGCCAAGVFLYEADQNDKIIYIYVLSETREGKTKYNFPGGKRNYKHETARKIAKRELREETGIRYLCNSPLLWYGPGKYALYGMQYRGCCSVDKLTCLKWSELKEDEFHPFAWQMISALKNSGNVRFL